MAEHLGHVGDRLAALLNARVKIVAAPDGYHLVYTRYNIRRTVVTGTRSYDEALEMAARIETTLVTEQERKAACNPSWRPDGIEPPPVRERAGPFNPAARAMSPSLSPHLLRQPLCGSGSRRSSPNAALYSAVSWPVSLSRSSFSTSLRSTKALTRMSQHTASSPRT